MVQNISVLDICVNTVLRVPVNIYIKGHFDKIKVITFTLYFFILVKIFCVNFSMRAVLLFLPARTQRVQAGTESQKSVYMYVYLSVCLPLSLHPPPVLPV